LLLLPVPRLRRERRAPERRQQRHVGGLTPQPSSVIDLHCHILPGVDDGAVNLADAVAMCRLAAADGCTVMVATPHSRHGSFPKATREALAAAHDELVAALAAGAPEERLEVRMGAEVRVDSELIADLEA